MAHDGQSRQPYGDNSLFHQKCPDIPWSEKAGMRDMPIHLTRTIDH